MSIEERAQKLRSLVRLLSDSAEVVIKEWEKEELATDSSSRDTAVGVDLPSPTLLKARRIFVGACRMGMDLVQDSIQRLTVLAASFLTLVPFAFADLWDGVDPKEGLPIDDIVARVGISTQQLSELVKCECGSISAQTGFIQLLFSDAYVPPMFSTKSEWIIMPITQRAVLWCTTRHSDLGSWCCGSCL